MTLDFNDIAPLPDPNRRTLSDAEREELQIGRASCRERVYVLV